MADVGKKREQLIEEVEALRTQVAALQQAEAERAQVEEAYRAVVEHSLQGLAILQEDRVVFANPAMAEMLGYTIEELCSLSSEEVTEVVHPDDQALVWGRLRERLAGKAMPQRYEFRVIGKDGTERWVETFSSPIEYRGKPAIQSAFMDITERVQAEEALRESEEKYRALVEQSSDGISIIQDEIVQYVNPRVGEMWRGPHEEVIGTPFTDYVHPDELPKVADRYRRRMAGEEFPSIYETVLKRKDGSSYPAELNAGLITYRGRPADLVMIRDISERVRAEEEIQRRSRELTLLNRVIAAATSALEVEKVLEVTCRELAQTFEVPQSAAALLNDERTEATVVAEYLAEGRPSALGEVIPLAGTPATQYVVEHKMPLAISDAQSDPRMGPVRELMRQRGTVSLLIVPLIVRDEVVGTIGVDATKRHEFGGQESELAASVAAAVAQALDNAHLFESEQQAHHVAERLRETGLVVSSSLDLEQVLDFVLDQLAKVVPYDGSEVELLQGDVAVVIAERGMGESRLREFLLDEFPYNRLLARGKEPLLVPDLHDYPDWKFVEGAKDVRSVIGLPLIVRDNVIGILNVFSYEVGRFSQEDAEVAAAFAQQAAIAIENARLYRELEEHAEVLGKTIRERTAELRRTKERVEAILTNSPDAILLLEADGKIKTGNLAFYEMFGYEVDEAYSQPLTNLAETEHVGPLDEAVRHVATWGEAVRLEIVAQRKDETTFDADTALAPIREDGEVRAVVCSLRDISALKEVERMKDVFVSNVSHELRTPITSIKLYLSLLEEGRTTRWPEYLDTLKSEAERMARLIEELLDISRIDAGRTELTLGPLRLAELVEMMLDHYLIQAEVKQLKLGIELDQSAPPALADSLQMAKVLTNLVSNAINYTPEGGEVTILTGHAEREGERYATLTVSDTGTGISEDELPHVFERFFRGARVRQSGIPGTGLGLAIVKEIVDMHNGLIEIDSQVGNGTSITVWLPPGEE